MEDYILVLDHNAKASPGERLEILAPVDNAGRFTDAVQDFAGQHVFKANPAIVECLPANGRLLGHGSLNHSYPHCWRCKNPVIFRATEQWFVSMETNDLRQERAWRRSIASVDSALGQRPDQRHDRQPSRLVSRRGNGCGACRSPVSLCSSCRTVLADPNVIEHIAGHHGIKGGRCLVRAAGGRVASRRGPPAHQCGGIDRLKKSGTSSMSGLNPA